VPGSTSVRTVGIVWDSCPRARSRTAARTTPRRSKTKQSCIDDLEKVVLTAIYAGFWVILTGRAEYAACQSTSSPNVFQNLTLRAQYLKMWKLNDAYFIDQPISNIICTFDNFFSDMFCQESEGSAYSYPFFVLCVVVFKGWIPDILSY